MKLSKPIKLTNKTLEAVFSRELNKLLDLLYRMYVNQVINKFVASNDKKYTFEDSKTGYITSVKRISNALSRRFSFERVQDIVNWVFGKVDKVNQGLYTTLGYSEIETARLVSKEGLSSFINLLNYQTTDYTKRLIDDTLIRFNEVVLNGITNGDSFDTILENTLKPYANARTRAKFIARQQVNNYNTQVTKARAVKAGFTKAVWVSGHDSRVRLAHAWRNGKEFNLDEGLYSSIDGKTLLPAQDFNCRCTMKIVIEF